MPDNLQFMGDVSIEPCRTTNNGNIHIAIMGPTGAGKSTFIEALAGKGKSLGISKDQLAGFTQEVNTYTLTNTKFACYSGSLLPIVLVDTPGFSDRRISELEILDKVKKWMADHSMNSIDFILYLCPITDTRVPGSKRRIIKVLELLMQNQNPKRIMIVTTMWDRIEGSNLHVKERAEAHFEQLQADIWKELVRRGAQIAKFQNDQESALNVLRSIIQSYPAWFALHFTRTEANDPSTPLLYHELVERISNTRQEWRTLRIEKIQLLTKPDKELESYVAPKLQEVEHDLERFLRQIAAFGWPPPEFQGVPQQLVSQHLLDHVETAQEDISAIKLAILQLNLCDWKQRSSLKSQLQEAELRLGELSKCPDPSGTPMQRSDFDRLKQVLELLHPKARTATVSLAARMKEEFGSLKDKLMSS